MKRSIPTAGIALFSLLLVLAPPAVPGGAAPLGPARYVALGDSYSAGAGLPPYEPGTDTETNRCHRSTSAYSAQFAATPAGRRFQRVSFACGGATTADFFRGGRADDAPEGQIARVPVSARLVTLTVGGNDLGFGEAIRACTIHDCTDDPAFADMPRRIENLRGPLRNVYAAIRARAPTAKVLVLGYPNFVSNENQVRFCHADFGLSSEEKDWIRGHLGHLDDVIEAEATRVGARYVDTQEAFAGHEVCTKEPWSFGLDRHRRGSSYHPNARGHQVLAEALAKAV